MSTTPPHPRRLAERAQAAAAATLHPARTPDEPPRWRYTPATLEQHAAAIVAVHTARHAPSPRDALVRQTLAGIRRATAAPHRSGPGRSS